MNFSTRNKNPQVSQSPKTRSHDHLMVSPSHHNTRFSSQNHARNNVNATSHPPASHRGTNGCSQRSTQNGISHDNDKVTVNGKNYAPLSVALPNGCSSRISVDSNDNSIDSFHTTNSMSSPQTTFNGLVQISAPATAAASSTSSSSSSTAVHKSTNGHASASKCQMTRPYLPTETAEVDEHINESTTISDSLLQPFEKATSIYRYLAALRKNGISLPIFLHRNLSYMQGRGEKPSSKVRCKKIDEIASKLDKELKVKMKQNFAPISIKIFCLDDKIHTANFNGNSKSSNTASITVEVINKFTNGLADKRFTLAEDIALPVKPPNVPTSPTATTRVNTRNDNARITPPPTLTISKESFPFLDPKYSKSHLALTVTVRSSSLAYSSPNTRSVSSNGANSTLSPRDCDMKKRKRSSALSPSASNGVPQVTSPRREPPSYVSCILSAEVPLINDTFQSVLMPGSYELPMYKLSKGSSSNAAHRLDYGNENFDYESKLHFECTQGKGGSYLAAKKSPSSHLSKISPVSPSVTAKKRDNQLSNESTQESAVRITYRFFVDQTNFQPTQSCTNDLICPWCSVSCLKLKQLAAHLKNCHERFNFRVRSEGKSPKVLEAIVDVVPNDSYDGSYSGNPYELSFSSTVGIAFSRLGPLRRNPTTTLLVNKRGKIDFRDPNRRDSYEDLYDADIDTCRPTVFGHDRLYYHSHTCLPIRPQDMDEDSESEADPEWMRKRTQQMIDEFTDVNEGEKEMIKIWNLHIMKYGFVGDCQMYKACEMFIEHHAQEILSKNLRYNFILHLMCLYDYGLIDALQKASLVQKLTKPEHVHI